MDLTLLDETLAAHGEPSFRASQIWAWAAKGVDGYEQMTNLPARLREPFLLHNYAGFSVREVAGLLKRPEGTIKADLYHARAKLKEMLEAPATIAPRGMKGTRGGKAHDAR